MKTPRAAKHRILFLVLLLIISSSTAMAADIVTGLVGHWKLDGNGIDSSGQGNNGTVVGATGTTDRFATASRAMDFNGTSAYVALPVSLVVALGSPHYIGSVSFWANGSGYSVSINRTTSSQTGYAMLAVGASFRYENCDTLSPPFCHTIASVATATPGAWNHFVFTADGAHNYKMAVNGVITNITYTFNTLAGDVFTQLNIARSHNYVWGDSYFAGSIDDVKIYNRALTADDVLALYNNGGPTTIRNAAIRNAAIR